MPDDKYIQEFNNPLDNFYLNIIEKINPILYKLNFTPNIITTISFILGLLTAYFIYRECYISAGISYFFSYFFDCVDGNFARKYNMTSKFGDYYDHITDCINNLLILYVILSSKLYSYSFKKNILIYCHNINSIRICSSGLY